MSNRIIEFFRSRIEGEKPLHPIERRVAKRWVKQRLLKIFPELRNDPKALEEVYRQLSLEAKPGSGEGGGTVFEVTLPDKLL